MDRTPGRRLGLAAAFSIAFLATRLPGLTRLPVFLDEAMHIQWATTVAETGRLLGIGDGGRYLPIWLLALTAADAEDPLRAARLTSVAWGLAAALGLVLLGCVLYTERAGWLAAALYTVLPSTLLYDRMALVDSMLGALVVAALAATARWADTARLSWAVAAGAAIGCAGITKLYGAVLLLLPLLFLALRPGAGRSLLRPQVILVQGMALGAMLPAFLDLGATLAFVHDNVSFLRPGGAAGLGRSASSALLWTAEQLTPLGFALVVLAALHAGRRLRGADAVLLAFWLAWTAFFVATGGRDWFPRYLLPGCIPLLLFVADSALRTGDELGQKGRRAPRHALGFGLLALLAAAGVPAGLALLRDPASAPMVGIDRWQYVQDWPSGYRLDDVAGLLASEAARKDGVLVVRDQRSGPLLEGLDLVLRRRRSGIEFVDLYLHRGALAAAAPRLAADRRPVLLAIQERFGHHLMLSLEGRLAPLRAAFAKPSRSRHFEIYCLGGDCAGPLVDHASLDLDELGLEAPRTPPPGLDGPRALEQARLCMQEDGERSLAACRRALAEGLSLARAAEVHYSAGRTLASGGRHREAALALREAVRLLPADAPLALAFVENLETLRQHEQALEVARDVLRYAPDSAAAEGRVGYSLACLGRLVEAAQALERAVAAGAGAGAGNDLGVVLFLLGRMGDAEAALRRAVAEDPEGLRQRANLSLVLAARARSRRQPELFMKSIVPSS